MDCEYEENISNIDEKSQDRILFNENINTNSVISLISSNEAHTEDVTNGMVDEKDGEEESNLNLNLTTTVPLSHDDSNNNTAMKENIEEKEDLIKKHNAIKDKGQTEHSSGKKMKTGKKVLKKQNDIKKVKIKRSNNINHKKTTLSKLLENKVFKKIESYGRIDARSSYHTEHEIYPVGKMKEEREKKNTHTFPFV